MTHRFIALTLLTLTGCAAPAERPRVTKPSLAPATQPTASLDVEASEIGPMYRELLTIDLPTVARVATARSLDIAAARQRLSAARGQYETSVEAIFPVIAPSLAYQHLSGVNQQANGLLVHTTFNTFLPAIAVQWILNPGRVVYDIVASKRRMEAAEDQADASRLDVTHRAAVQYYDLVLTQARLGVARQAVGEAEEFLRITQVRVRAGNGLPVDELRAQSALSAKQQDLALALNAFYQASVRLTLTLHLDPVVTLVPAGGSVGQATLVTDDLPIDELLAMAVRYRPDLDAARALLKAANADRSATVWGELGPQVQAGYSVGGIGGNALGQSYSLHKSERGNAAVGFALGAPTFGQVKVATAQAGLAGLDVQRQLDEVRAAVVSARQTSVTNARLVPMARQQMDAAAEALRLAQANLRAGTMLAIDVLQAQDAVDQARLRYVDAVIHYNQSQVDLSAALGVLEAPTLFAGAPTTQPGK